MMTQLQPTLMRDTVTAALEASSFSCEWREVQDHVEKPVPWPFPRARSGTQPPYPGVPADSVTDPEPHKLVVPRDPCTHQGIRVLYRLQAMEK